jgi:PAS domain S-box-containing protein
MRSGSSAVHERPANSVAARDPLHLSEVFDAVSHPLILLNADLCVARANRAFHEQLPLAPRDIAGRSIFEIGDGLLNTPGMRVLLERLAADAAPADAIDAVDLRCDCRGVSTTWHLSAARMPGGHRDQRRILVELHRAAPQRPCNPGARCDPCPLPVIGPSQPATPADGVAHHGTACQLAQRQLEASERRFRQMAQSIREVFYVADPHAPSIEYVSPAFEQIFGRSCQSLLDDPGLFIHCVHPDDREHVREAAAKTAAGEACDIEYRVQRPDGSLCWVRDRGFPVRDVSGRVIRITGIAENITKRRQAEQASQQHKELLQTIIDRIPVMLVVFDAELRPVVVNQEAERVMGWSLADLEGRNVLRECYPDASLYRTVRDFIGQASAQWRDFAARARDGRTVIASWTNVRLSDGSTIGIGQDVTERRRTERLEQEHNGLRHVLEAHERVLGVVGHELRTPLAAIRALAEFLVSDGALQSPDSARFASNIRDEAVRMSELVNDLLEVARLNSGTARWTWSSFRLHHAAAQALESVRPLVNAQRVQLTLHVEPVDLQMLGDAAAIRRLVLNLLSNAIKHTDHGSIAVTASAEVQDGTQCVRLVVRDSGEGISPTTASRLGEAFVLNAGSVGESFTRGSGLGLAICKGIVAAHGGAIRVASAPGEGTTVTVLLRADLSQPMQDVRGARILLEDG